MTVPAALVAKVTAELVADYEARLVACPSCEGVGYHLLPWAVRDTPLDRVECRPCDGTGLVTRGERADWWAFQGCPDPEAA